MTTVSNMIRYNVPWSQNGSILCLCIMHYWCVSRHHMVGNVIRYNVH